jgi:hypothetical protein
VAERFASVLSTENVLWKYLPEDTVMAIHLKPLDAGSEGNLWKILSKDEGEGWLNEPEKSSLFINCYIYSLFACVESTVRTYHCVDKDEAKDLKKKRAAFMRTLKWIVKYYEMNNEEGEQF